MDKSLSLRDWWLLERAKELDKLKEKANTEPLSEVEIMIINPFNLDQARNQVKMLNGHV